MSPPKNFFRRGGGIELQNVKYAHLIPCKVLHIMYILLRENLKFIDNAEEAIDCFKQLSKVIDLNLFVFD